MPRGKKKVEEEPFNNIVSNVYELMPSKYKQTLPNPNYNLHKIKTPFRMLIVSYSGGGKTNFVANLLSLFSKGHGTFSKILIITRQSSEPIYKWLVDVTEGQIVVTENISDLPPLDEKNFDKNENSLIIFDDLVLNKDQSRIEQYYIRCRKLGISAIYISQSYYRTPKVIRGNINYLVLLKLGTARDIRMILSENSIGIGKEQLEKMYKYATTDKFQALVVDNDAPVEEKFRKNFTEILNPTDYV
jgi:hypothetical protein